MNQLLVVVGNVLYTASPLQVIWAGFHIRKKNPKSNDWFSFNVKWVISDPSGQIIFWKASKRCFLIIIFFEIIKFKYSVFLYKLSCLSLSQLKNLNSPSLSYMPAPNHFWVFPLDFSLQCLSYSVCSELDTVSQSLLTNTWLKAILPLVWSQLVTVESIF